MNTNNMEDKTSTIDEHQEHANLEYGGFWQRTVATLIDWVWLYGLMYGIIFMTIGYDNGHPIVQFMFEFVIPFIVVIALWKLKQSTPGKMVFGFIIVDSKTLGKVSTGRLILRYFAYLICILSLFIGCIWVAFDRKKQGWHDKIAGTLIIKSKAV